MTLAEFNAVIHKGTAWRVLFKVAVAIIGGCATLFTLALPPVLVVNTLKNRADESDRNVTRLEQQVTGLTRTVGELKLTVTEFKTEVKASRSDSAEILRRMDQQRPAPARTTAIAPARRTQ